MRGPPWAIIVPLVADKPGFFFLVRQWRHGAKALSLEFPGGVVEKGETPEQGARRELLEETGCTAERLTLLGSMNPNPAIMSNTVHIFLAEGCRRTGNTDPDSDEFLNVEETAEADMITGMGKPPYLHALMASALGLYLAHKQKASSC
jgi:8-oxo-dGTP pyrophosphatase MutT (NUDIX family)